MSDRNTSRLTFVFVSAAGTNHSALFKSTFAQRAFNRSPMRQVVPGAIQSASLLHWTDTGVLLPGRKRAVPPSHVAENSKQLADFGGRQITQPRLCLDAVDFILVVRIDASLRG